MSGPLLLVVEDDRDVRDAMVDVLRDAGYQVAWAPEGAEAIRVLREGLRPAAILLDLMMPGMNGFQFRAEQQRDPALAAIPVILLTAARALERDVALLQASAQVPKPSRTEELLAAISRVAGVAGP